MSQFDNTKNTSHETWRRPPRRWAVQTVPPRDQYEACTLTIEQWLENPEASAHFVDKRSKWWALMEACALVLDLLDGLRQEPRVGYDPVGDQPFFIFKSDNNGTTHLVSPDGIEGVEEIG